MSFANQQNAQNQHSNSTFHADWKSLWLKGSLEMVWQDQHQSTINKLRVKYRQNSESSKGLK